MLDQAPALEIQDWDIQSLTQGFYVDQGFFDCLLLRIDLFIER